MRSMRSMSLPVQNASAASSAWSALDSSKAFPVLDGKACASASTSAW
jgi:hypothetical protein